MSDKNFEKSAVKALSYITDTVEESDEEYILDVNSQSDILKIETPKGPFIINKHSAAKQVWLASPISGPYHFDPKDGKWINRDNIDLYQLLNNELKEFIDIELKYE